MDVARESNVQGVALGASVYASVPAERLYEAVRDVRGFPRWAPGVRRVEVIRAPGEPGMFSEWEVAFFGFRRKVWSVLEEVVPRTFLRWSYGGQISGWGRCELRSDGGWTLAEFRTELELEEAWMRSLLRSAPVREAAHGHLRRALGRLGAIVTRDGGRFVVGPLGQSKA